MGWRTVVSAGLTCRPAEMSSNPVTATSAGTRSRARPQRGQCPERHLVVSADDRARPAVPAAISARTATAPPASVKSPEAAGPVRFGQASVPERVPEAREPLVGVRRLLGTGQEDQVGVAVHADQMRGHRARSAPVVGLDVVGSLACQPVRQHDDRHDLRQRDDIVVGQASCQHHQAVDLAGHRERELATGRATGSRRSARRRPPRSPLARRRGSPDRRTGPTPPRPDRSRRGRGRSVRRCRSAWKPGRARDRSAPTQARPPSREPARR